MLTPRLERFLNKPMLEMMSDSTPRDNATYRIGMVAQLTGLSVNTIRTWERRHGALAPMRSKGGGRLYSDQDIERLVLLKQLTERGAAISTVAPLGNPALTARLRRRGPTELAPPSGLRVALLHRSLGGTLEDHQSPLGDWDVRVNASTAEGFIDAVATSGPVDALILDLALLGPQPAAMFARCVEAASVNTALVVYHFAARRVLDELAAAGARVLRAPVAPDELHRRAHDLVRHRAADARSRPDGGVPPPPRYSDQQLYEFRAIDTGVDCECPHHLAELVETLVSFERYSAACASRSPEDRKLHQSLQHGTARARLQVEDLLDLVIKHEGIVV